MMRIVSGSARQIRAVSGSTVRRFGRRLAQRLTNEIRHSFDSSGQAVRIPPAGLRQMGPPATATADDLGHFLDQVAGSQASLDQVRRDSCHEHGPILINRTQDGDAAAKARAEMIGHCS
jgi:hypothetical protein